MAPVPPIQIENLTESFQKHLGLQQAQSFTADNVTGDAIARLYNQRSDLDRLVQLWSDDRADVVKGWSDHPEEYEAVLRTLTRIVEQGFVTRHKSSGQPSAFLPLALELVTNDQPDVVFRQQGVSVLNALWVDEDLRARIRARIDRWREQHVVARLLAPLGSLVPLRERTPPSPNIVAAMELDRRLRDWVSWTVREDWEAWLKASERLSVDEQLQTMTGLISLHLHIALLWRLWPQTDGAEHAARPLLFASAVRAGRGNDLDRAARNVFDWWADRAHVKLCQVAREAVARVAQSSPELERSLSGDSWVSARLWAIPVATRATSVTRAWESILLSRVKELAATGAPPAANQIEEVVVDCLVRAFTRGNSSVVSKVRDFLRVTGGGAGIVGSSRARGRKHYLLGDRALELLARLHVERPEVTVRTRHEEPRSLEAMIDDVFERYGIVVSADREVVKSGIAALEESAALRVLRKRFPNEDAMRENGREVERRLEELRLLRRYSDASAVIRLP
jgi:hypothetical protein